MTVHGADGRHLVDGFHLGSDGQPREVADFRLHWPRSQRKRLPLLSGIVVSRACGVQAGRYSSVHSRSPPDCVQRADYSGRGSGDCDGVRGRSAEEIWD